MRTLAQRSAAAAKEVKQLIDDSVGKVESGTELVGRVGQTMQEIVASIQRVTDIMGEIAAASQEQTRGIEQVNQAITQMDQVTQQNAALVEEASAAACASRPATRRAARRRVLCPISGRTAAGRTRARMPGSRWFDAAPGARLRVTRRPS